MTERETDWNDTEETPVTEGMEVDGPFGGNTFEISRDGEHLALLTWGEARDLMLALGAKLGYAITKED